MEKRFAIYVVNILSQYAFCLNYINGIFRCIKVKSQSQIWPFYK